MTPAYIPMQISNRRSRLKFSQGLKQRHEEAEMNNLIREQELNEACDKMLPTDLPEDMQGLRDGIRMMAKAQFGKSFPVLPASEEAFRAEELEKLSEMFSGSYLQQTASGYKLWDFNKLLQGAISIEFKSEPLSVVLDIGPEVIELVGDDAQVGIALIRYIHHLGVFELEAAKRPCPECSTSEPKDCDTCGGCGWILDSANAETPDLSSIPEKSANV
jgi:hypothetical protein